MKTLNHFVALLLSITALVSFATEKIVVITHSYNRPDFIEIQHKTLKAFLEDEYEFVVFNDARGQAMCDEINSVCARLGIRCIRIPYSIHIGRDNSCEACADVVQYSLDTFGFDYPGIVAILDSDMFLIKKFSIKNFLAGYDLAGCPQSRGNGKVNYIWNGIVFMDMRTLPNRRTMNWDCGKVDGESVDVGGQMHHYLKNNPGLRVKYLGVLHSDSFSKDTQSLKALKFDDTIIEYLIMKNTHNIEFFIDNHFLHYRGGTNWDQKSKAYHQEKSKILNDFINKITENCPL